MPKETETEKTMDFLHIFIIGGISIGGGGYGAMPMGGGLNLNIQSLQNISSKSCFKQADGLFHSFYYARCKI